MYRLCTVARLVSGDKLCTKDLKKENFKIKDREGGAFEWYKYVQRQSGVSSASRRLPRGRGGGEVDE